jgi:hypothetical protein
MREIEEAAVYTYCVYFQGRSIAKAINIFTEANVPDPISLRFSERLSQYHHRSTRQSRYEPPLHNGVALLGLVHGCRAHIQRYGPQKDPG